MTDEFNRTLFFDNIAFKLKETGKKIGELENEAGVSPGYISRTSKDGSTRPGIDFIMRVAAALNISVDTLLKVDLTKLSPTEQYLYSFIDKLIKDTAAGKLDWQRETADYLNNRLEINDFGYCEHDLFEKETFYEKGESDHPDKVTRIVFASHSYDVHTWIAGDCYHLGMKDYSNLYIMSICKSVQHRMDPNTRAKEIWMCKNGTSQFLCSTKDTTRLSSYIEFLYATVTEDSRHPKVQKDIKDVIDAFMDDGGEDIPF